MATAFRLHPRHHPHRTVRHRLIGVLTSFAVLLLFAISCGPHHVESDPEKVIERTNAAKEEAAALIEAKDYQAAVDVLAPFAARNVKDPQVYSMIARSQWGLGETDYAIANYENAMRLDYTDTTTHMQLAQLLIEIGKTGRALTEFELAVQHGNRDPLPHYNYGLALFDLGRREDALAQWETAYSLDRNNASYAEAVGIGLSGEDDDAALPYFEKADSLGADTPGFHNNFGLLLQRLGHYDRAETEFKRALDADADNRSYRANLALLYMAARRFAEAVPLWEGLFAGAEADPAYRIYLARALLETERFRQAADLLDGWLARVTADPGLLAKRTPERVLDPPALDVAYDVLAMAQRGDGELDRAEVNIRKAVEMKPDNLVHLINYGVILAENGKIADARTQWQRVLELDPGNPVAEQNLSAFAR